MKPVYLVIQDPKNTLLNSPICDFQRNNFIFHYSDVSKIINLYLNVLFLMFTLGGEAYGVVIVRYSARVASSFGSLSLSFSLSLSLENIA